MPRTPTILAAALLALLAGAGCITVDVLGKKPPPIPDRFHVLDTADLGSGLTKTTPEAGAIAVRVFRARDRFDRNVVQRVGGASSALVTPLEYDLWADMPNLAVTDAVREALAASGSFSAAVDPADAVEAKYVLDGTILDFAWVDAPSAALFRVRLTLSESKTGRVLVTGVYSATEPLPGADTGGLGPAMGRAVGKALRAALDRWTAAGVLKNTVE